MVDYQLNCRGCVLSLSSRPVIMGILNVTPDSFSDGGCFVDPDVAVGRALEMIEEGAGIIDIGGESTRPGAVAVSPKEQIARTVPVIERVARQCDIPISIDTTSSEVAAAALDAGAAIINDISALRFDEEMAGLAARTGAPVILMHMQGTPGTMQKTPTYDDVVQDVRQFLGERIVFAEKAGIVRSQIVIDPGIGFGKSLEHNLLLMRHLGEFHDLGAAVLVGPSRKSFIGKVLDEDDPDGRLFGTAATVSCCVAAGVQIIRVHDTKEMTDVARVAYAIHG